MPEWSRTTTYFCDQHQKAKWFCSTIYITHHHRWFSSCCAGSVTVCFCFYTGCSLWNTVCWGGRKVAAPQSNCEKWGQVPCDLTCFQRHLWLSCQATRTVESRLSQSPWKHEVVLLWYSHVVTGLNSFFAPGNRLILPLRSCKDQVVIHLGESKIGGEFSSLPEKQWIPKCMCRELPKLEV